MFTLYAMRILFSVIIYRQLVERGEIPEDKTLGNQKAIPLQRDKAG